MKKETPPEKLLHGFKFGCRLIFPLHEYFKYSSTMMCDKGNEVSNLGQKTPGESTKVTNCSHLRKWQRELLKHSVLCVEIHAEFAFWEKNREQKLGFRK